MRVFATTTVSPSPPASDRDGDNQAAQGGLPGGHDGPSGPASAFSGDEKLPSASNPPLIDYRHPGAPHSLTRHYLMREPVGGERYDT